MVPGVVLRIAGDPGGYPFLIHIVVNVPLMASGNAALVSPNKSLPLCELINIELDGLGIGNVLGVEINVIDEVVSVIR